ncbi:MAG: hypothetical protein LBE83_10895 [Propionibacteriaceae bacterium]|jgi:hypothetical protein|nr:hypothetical protein [Propionibacteriaceae bacterium]
MTTEASEVRLDYYLPTYQYSDRYETVIQASPERVYEALQAVSLNESKITRFLLGLRTIFSPSQWRAPADVEELSLTERTAGGDDLMTLLEEVKNRELVLGFAGKFWRPIPKIVPFTCAEEFLAYAEPGNAKSAWNLLITPTDGQTTLSTETRILLLGGESKFFGVYWAIIKPFSGLIRKQLLHSVKQRAESVTT